MKTKKMYYITPVFLFEDCETSEMICDSKNTSTSSNTGYGTDGPDTKVEDYTGQTPAKESDFVWNFDFEQ